MEENYFIYFINKHDQPIYFPQHDILFIYPDQFLPNKFDPTIYPVTDLPLDNIKACFYSNTKTILLLSNHDIMYTTYHITTIIKTLTGWGLLTSRVIPLIYFRDKMETTLKKYLSTLTLRCASLLQVKDPPKYLYEDSQFLTWVVALNKQPS